MILVGHLDTKTWWKNFRTERDLELLIRGRWTNVNAIAVVGAHDVAETAPPLDAHLTRFLRAQRTLDEETPDDRAKRAVVVRCQTPTTAQCPVG